MKLQIRSIAVPVAFLVLAAGTSALSAATIDETQTVAPNLQVPTRTVSYADLDLASAEGREVLERRVRRAARIVCDHYGFTRHGSLRYQAQTRACYDEAVADALGQVSDRQQVVAVAR